MQTKSMHRKKHELLTFIFRSLFLLIAMKIRQDTRARFSCLFDWFSEMEVLDPQTMRKSPSVWPWP